jgi:hypothetical protein
MRVVLMALAALAASAQLHAQVPTAPQVTVGAGIKSFRFDWEPAARAARYELWQRASASAAFQKTAEYPAATTNADLAIATYSLDWSGARFRIAACNSSGCANSPDISVASLRLWAPGYFKSSQPAVAETFGSDVDVTPSGAYFVAAAPNDAASGVSNAGAAYVFRRNSNLTTWSQRARLLPAIIQAEGGAGLRVAISADGNTVAMGLPNIFHAQTDPNSGEVYVFHYAGSASGWQRTRIAAKKGGSFGAWVSLDDAGQVLAVGRDSGADIYLLANGAWALRRAIENRTSPADNCPNGKISGSGRLLVETCFNGSAATPARSYLRIHSSYASSRRDLELQRSGSSADQRFGLAVDYTGAWIAAQNFNGRIEVDIFQKISGWHQFSQRVTAGSWQTGKRSLFGQGLSLNSDGSVLAVGDPVDVGQGTGVLPGTLTAGSTPTGAVYVFKRTGTSWASTAVIKPNYLLGAGGGAAQTFGAALSLSETGATLAVGQPLESSDAVGIDAAWNNTRRAQSGAVWLY